jgi:light-regulated signal transduction histidine kinase (bacteriophytochrome)
VTKDFSDLELTSGVFLTLLWEECRKFIHAALGFETVAGLLYVPLSRGGKDFIALLRKGQPQHVRWAGKPYKDGTSDTQATLEPRKSFKIWSEIVAGRSRAWTEEQLETAGVLALVYGKVRGNLISFSYDFDSAP